MIKAQVSGKLRLLNAAEQLFVRGSFPSVTVAQILAISKLRPPTLYHHFEDKEALYVSWACLAMKRTGDRIRLCATLVDVAKAIIDEPLIDLIQTRLDYVFFERKSSKTSIELCFENDICKPVKHVMEGTGVPVAEIPDRLRRFIYCLSLGLPRHSEVPNSFSKIEAVSFALQVVTNGVEWPDSSA